MAHARTRKHYRVAQKEAAATPPEGIFIAKAARSKEIAIAIALFCLAFVDGFILGFVLGRKKEKPLTD